MTRKSFPFPVLPLLLLLGIFYLTFVGRVVLSPLLPMIETDLGIGHGQAGSLFLYMASGYGAGLLGSGFVSSRLNHRRSLILSASGVGASLAVISSSSSIGAMHAGLVLLGIFAAFYLPSGIATLTEITTKEHWGKVMAIHELAPSTAFTTAPLLAEGLLTFFSWRGSLTVIGGCAILTGALFSLFSRAGQHRGEAPRLEVMRHILRTPTFWLAALLFTVSIGSSMGVYTMMPLFLVSEMGMERGWANTLIGFSRAFGIVGLFVSGFITDRFGPKSAMTFFLVITAGFTLLLGFLRGPVATPVLLFLQAASSACLFPVGFTIVSLAYPPGLRGVAVSMVILVGFLLGGGAVPSALGHLAEALSFSTGLILLGVFFIATLPVFLRIRGRQNQ